MNYYRLYPIKNNTILNIDGVGTISNQTKSLNTGKNPIMELHSGIKNSELLFSFQFPDWIKDQINNNNNIKCNLVLYDSGAIYDNVMGERKITISTFYDDFVEGNGWSFELNNIPHFGFSNFNNRNENDLWSSSDKNLGLEQEYQLDDYHQDITFDLTSMLDGSKDNVNLRIKTKHNYTEQQIIKFIHSRHTKTIYKPYLEFILNDEIIDNRFCLKSGVTQRVYLLNPNKTDFTKTLTCLANLEEMVVNNLGYGVYFIDVNTTDEYLKLEWFLDTEKFYEENYDVKSENPFTKNQPINTNFYIAPTNNSKTYRVGDVIKFNVQSFTLKGGNMIDSTYEYKVITNNGFTMQPWTKCNVYRDEIWFDLNLGFYFPEMNYDILLRKNNGQNIETSKDNFNFRVLEDAEVRFKQLSANPYYTREWFFSK